MRCRGERLIVGMVVMLGLTVALSEATAGPLVWLRDRREAELQSEVSHRVRHELSHRMGAVRNDLADMLGLEFADEASRLEAKVDEATAQLQEQHAQEIAELAEAFAAESEALREQVGQQLAAAEKKLAKQSARAEDRLDKSLQAEVRERADKIEGRLNRLTAEELARLAVANEVRIERAIDRSTELLGRRVERSVRAEMANATRLLEQQIAAGLASHQQMETPRPGQPRGDQKRSRDRSGRERADETTPATTKISLPESVDLPMAPLPPPLAAR